MKKVLSKSTAFITLQKQIQKAVGGSMGGDSDDSEDDVFIVPKIEPRNPQ